MRSFTNSADGGRRDRGTANRTNPRIWAAVAAGVLSLAAWPPVTATGSGNPTGVNCATPYDTYAVTALVLQACGVKSFPLEKVDVLDDGGLSYQYTISGISVWMNVPPKDFDATTASFDELQVYGIPPAPASDDIEASLEWEDMASHLSFVTPPAELHTIPVSATTTDQTSANWSGYVDHDVAGSFKQAFGGWTEPAAGSSSCSSNSALFWAGLGGWNSQFLAQNGTGLNTPGLGQHQAWWEILPAIGSIVAVNFYASQGFTFEASTSQSIGYNFKFFWYNAHTDTSMTLNTSHVGYDGSTAELIAERPIVNGSLTNLTNFGSLSMRLTANNVPLGNYNNWRVTMKNAGGTSMAVPGTLQADGESFTDVWKRCD